MTPDADEVRRKAQEPWQPKRRHLWAWRVTWVNAGVTFLNVTGLGAVILHAFH